jgi:hypothetical protein
MTWRPYDPQAKVTFFLPNPPDRLACSLVSPALAIASSVGIVAPGVVGSLATLIDPRPVIVRGSSPALGASMIRDFGVHRRKLLPPLFMQALSLGLFLIISLSGGDTDAVLEHLDSVLADPRDVERDQCRRLFGHITSL